MDAVFNDAAVLRVFTREGQGPEYPSIKDTRVAALDWVQGLEFPRCQTVPIEELSKNTPILRAIFPELNRPNTRFTDGLTWLVDYYSIPTAFLEGEIRSVAHSFGSSDTNDGYRSCWLNCLGKSLTVAEIAGSEPVITDHRLGGLEKRHGDMTWIRSGFFLRWSLDMHTPNVTLICFGGLSVMARFQRLSYNAVRDGAVHDPVSLLVVILHQLSSEMDHTIWDLSRVFGTIEFKALELNNDRESFTGLHNISKHIIYLQESSEAMLRIAKNLSFFHQDLSLARTERARSATRVTRQTIVQVEAEFEAISLRLRSLDRRMQNVIALSFHLVTQEANVLLQTDSSTMATIAFVTLGFLPIHTVAAICGSQFFNAAPDNASLEVSKDFWIFWAVSAPLTLVVFLGWYCFRRKREIEGYYRAWKGSIHTFLGGRAVKVE